MTGTHWDDASVQWLQENAGSYPLADLASKFNQQAHLRGWQPRTQNSVRIKLQKLGISSKCVDDNLSLQAWAKAFDICPGRVRRWKQQGLQVRRVRTLTVVSNREMGRFLQDRPDLAWGIEPWRLTGALGETIAQRILDEQPTRITGVARPIVCLDTGLTYASVRKAAKANYITPDAIHHAIKNGGRCVGKRWAYLDELEEQA